MLTFLEIQSKVDQICEKIGLEKKVWPAVQNDGTPYVLIHEEKYWYISAERGEVYFERKTNDFDELCYWIMDDCISSYSFDFELKNRTRGQDFRRIVFAKQIELFGLISDEWKVKKEKNIKKILERSPFEDN
ncbi:Imm63 family immunity protein [Acinetobacter sp. NigerLNRRAM0016]